MKNLIAQLRAQLAAGTQGKWEIPKGEGDTFGDCPLQLCYEYEYWELDATLIVTLRNNAEALLDYVEKLEGVAVAARNANRLLNGWDMIRQHSYAHEQLTKSLAALDEGSP